MGSGSSIPTEEENIKEDEGKQAEGDTANDDNINDTISEFDNELCETKSEAMLQIDECEAVSKRERYGEKRRESTRVPDQSFDACDFMIAIKTFDSIRKSAPEFEIPGMSANEIMQMEEDRKLKEEMEKLAKAKQEREIEIVKEERLVSLYNQLEARFAHVLEKNQDENLTVSQSVIDNLSNLVRKFHTKNDCEEPLPILEKRQFILEKKLRRRKRQRASLQDKHIETTPKRLQQTNPDIAELSSHSRAKKLAEQLSELYDHERKETFAATRSRLSPDVPDTQIAICLRDLFLFCFKRCHTLSDRQTNAILTCLNLSNSLPEDAKDVNNDTQSHTEAVNDLACRLLIKEFQKNVSRWTLTLLKKDIPREITQEKMFDIVTKTLRAPPYMPPLKQYLDKCIEVSWFSQYHHPTLAVIYDREPVNHALYIPYNTEGPYISKVLWPALVQPGGPVLVKGIAIFDNKMNSNITLQIGRQIVNS